MSDTSDFQRRTFLAGAAGVAASMATGTAMGADSATTSVAASASASAVAAPGLKPLPFDPGKLKGLSAKLIQSHWENNYGGSVKALAAVKAKLAEAAADKALPPFLYNEIKREHLLRTGSIVLHEAYFANLGGDGVPTAKERDIIARHFGSFEAWETEFRRMGLGLGGGSGWVVLGWNTHTSQLENYWMADHAHGAVATVPILVMDMYEHSYQMDYGAAAAKYVDAFFQNVQWSTVAQRLASAGVV